MEKKFKLGVIGAGFMSSAIVKGSILSGFIPANLIYVSDINQSSLDKMAKLGVCVTKDNRELVNNSEFVLFAIKPQNFSDVAKDICDCDLEKVISIMAGVKKQRIKDCLNNTVKVARCMPNTPCSVGSGAVGIDASDYTSIEDFDFVNNLFSSFAKTVFVSEEKLGAVTAVSGSAPAYFYLFISGLVKAGVKHGLTEEEALGLAVNTMIGSGKMILNKGDKTLDELINAVCSKGGTTVQAINVFNKNNLTEIISDAFDACVKRSDELENV